MSLFLPTPPPNYIRVAAAFCLHDHKLLIARRRPDKQQGGLWELPGGKVEPDESLQQCLEREIQEELGMTVRAGAVLAHCLHRYSGIGIQLIALDTRWLCGEPQLNDHDRLEWIKPNEWHHKTWAPADMPLLGQMLAAQSQLMTMPVSTSAF